MTISACSDLPGVPTNQSSVILTASFRVSLDPSMIFILSTIRAISLNKNSETYIEIETTKQPHNMITTTNRMLFIEKKTMISQTINMMTKIESIIELT